MADCSSGPVAGGRLSAAEPQATPLPTQPGHGPLRHHAPRY